MFVDSFHCMTLQLLLHIGGFLPLGAFCLSVLGKKNIFKMAKIINNFINITNQRVFPNVIFRNPS